MAWGIAQNETSVESSNETYLRLQREKREDFSPSQRIYRLNLIIKKFECASEQKCWLEQKEKERRQQPVATVE